jgi:transposase, IS6 family
VIIFNKYINLYIVFRPKSLQQRPVDFFLSEKQDRTAAKAFFEKVLRKPSNPEPEKVTADGHQAYPWAIKDLGKTKSLKKKGIHRTSKYLNNRIESDHACFKQKLKPMRGFMTVIRRFTSDLPISPNTVNC